MAAVTQLSSAPLRDSTFRFYKSEQGKSYATNRRGYHPRLYQAIIDYHQPAGQFDKILDVGCGPGTAVRDLAPLFTHAIGIDPSEGMISTAKSLGGVSESSEPVRFEISAAEDLGAHLSPPVSDGSVDLLIVATAAHWFDMSVFWHRAAQVVKPGGTVAIWTSGSMCVGPTTPNHRAVQAAIDRLQERVADYMVAGNLVNNNLYVDLPLPWTQTAHVEEFDRGSFVRKQWGTGENSEPGDQFYATQPPASLDVLELMLGTTSPVTRWREAHPDAVGTERDVVKMMRMEIEEVFHEVGVEKGKELVTGGVAGVLLMMKKNT